MKKQRSSNRQLRLFSQRSDNSDLINRLVAVCSESGSVVVTLGSVKEATKFTKSQIRYGRLTLGESPTQIFKSIVTNNLFQLLDRLDMGHTVREYAGASKLADDEVEHLDLSSDTHDRIRSQIAPLSKPLFVDMFEDNNGFMKNLRYYAITVLPYDGSEPIHCFKFYTEAHELQRSNKVIVVRGEGYYDMVDQPGFIFDDQVDCICYGHDMLIINKDKFQRIFRFYEYVQRDAEAAIMALHGRVPISNTVELIAAAKRDNAMAFRLADVPQKPLFQRLSLASIKRQIQRYSLPIRTITRNGTEALVYDPKHKAEFMHLICDGFLSSQMTLLHYVSVAHTPLPQQTIQPQQVIQQRQVIPPQQPSPRRKLSKVSAHAGV